MGGELCACLEAHIAGMAEVRQRVGVALKMYLKILWCVQLNLTVAAHQTPQKKEMLTSMWYDLNHAKHDGVKRTAVLAAGVIHIQR